MEEEAGQQLGDLIGSSMKGFKADLQILGAKVADLELRKMHWEDAKDQKYEELVPSMRNWCQV